MLKQNCIFESMSAVIKRVFLACVLFALGVLGSTSKWIVSLMPTATEQDMEQVKKWIQEHNYKVTDTISEYQLRVLFVEADNGIGKPLFPFNNA